MFLHRSLLTDVDPIYTYDLNVVRGRYPFYLYAYVLMPNHFHLLLEVQESLAGKQGQILGIALSIDPKSSLQPFNLGSCSIISLILRLS